MPRAGLDDLRYSDSDSMPMEVTSRVVVTDATMRDKARDAFPAMADRHMGPRRTPRKSLIVVLPDNHVVSPEIVVERMPRTEEDELVEVIVACAGQPSSLAALKRRVRDIQVLLAPAGTSPADLRELAIRQVPGDIVTLLSGAAQSTPAREPEMFRTV
jgi:hypothetical protein